MDKKPETVVLQAEWIVPAELADEAVASLQNVLAQLGQPPAHIEVQPADPRENRIRHKITSHKLQ